MFLLLSNLGDWGLRPIFRNFAKTWRHKFFKKSSLFKWRFLRDLDKGGHFGVHKLCYKKYIFPPINFGDLEYFRKFFPEKSLSFNWCFLDVLDHGEYVGTQIVSQSFFPWDLEYFRTCSPCICGGVSIIRYQLRSFYFAHTPRCWFLYIRGFCNL